MTAIQDIDWSSVHRILFVCHGNICRSTMAHYLLVKLLQDAGVTDVTVDSAATSTEEIGNPIYPPARAELMRHHIPILPHTARRLCAADAQRFDIILGADTANLANMRRMLPEGTEDKCFMLLDIAGEHRSVSDPWYTDDFQTTWNDVLKGCQAILANLLQTHPASSGIQH